MSKNYMSDNLETKVIDILNQNNVVNHYNPCVMSIAVKTICNIAISIASPSFKHTLVVNTLNLISNQLEVNPNSEHVAIGGVIATQLAALSEIEIKTPNLGSNSFFGDNFVNDLL